MFRDEKETTSAKMKYLTVLMALLGIVCFAACAIADDASHLEWGMTIQETETIMGGPGEEYEGASYGYTMIRYFDHKLNGDITGITVLVFKRNILQAKMFIIDDTGRGVYSYLGEVFENKYGASTNNASLVTELYGTMGQDISESMLELMQGNSLTSDMIVYKTWSSDGAVVCLTSLSDFVGDETYTILYFKSAGDQKSEVNYNLYEMNNDELQPNPDESPSQNTGKVDLKSIDFALYTDDELIELETRLREEMQSRGIK